MDDAREGRECGTADDAASRCQSDAPEGGGEMPERCARGRDAPERDCAQTEGLVRKGLPREGGDCRRIASCQRQGSGRKGDATGRNGAFPWDCPEGRESEVPEMREGLRVSTGEGLRGTRRRRGRRCANGDAPRGEAGGRPWIDGMWGGRCAGANPAFLEGGGWTRIRGGRRAGNADASQRGRGVPRRGTRAVWMEAGTGCRAEAGGRDCLAMGTTHPQDELMERGRERDVGREGVGTRCARETPA